MPVIIPNTYRNIITSTEFSGKNICVKTAYIGTLALHEINGISRIVIFLSRSPESVRVAITAGTEQPKPISSGTNERPESPILQSTLSITKAILAM